MPVRKERAGVPADPKGKVLSRSALTTRCAALRRSGRKIVFTNGCFDILHAGHARYLGQARAMGDILVVGINADASVRRLKGEGRPVQNERDRAFVIASLACVDLVCIFSEDTPEKLIRAAAPHVLVKGGDWKGKEIVGADFVKSLGGTVKTITFLKGRSTTSIIERTRKND